MKVFKVYMTIIKKNLPAIMIYFIVFATISVMMTLGTAKDNGNNTFQQSKIKVAFYDHDNTSLSQDIKKQIEKVADIEQIEENSDKVKDALFFRKINAVISIKEGFTKALLEQQDINKIEVNTIPNTYSSTYVEMAINNYLDTASDYIKHTDLTEGQLIEQVNQDIGKETKANLAIPEKSNSWELSIIYFNYISYVLFATVIIGIGSTMAVLNAKNIKRRMLCSPLSNKRLNFELVISHFVYSIVILFGFLAIGFIMSPALFTNPATILLVLNAICLLLAVISIAFFIGVLIKSKTAQSAAANVISLGTSFISGVFVPQEWLSDVVLKIANFTPVFWYVKANSTIREITTMDIASIKPILGYMAIEIGFAITFWLISLVISKRKRTSDN